MKIFHVITHLDLGGAERVAINIAKSENPNIEYHIVEVVRGQSNFTLQLINELKSYNVKVHRSPIKSKKIGIILFPLWFIFLTLKYKPQIIHTHTEIPDLSIYLFHILFHSHIIYIRTIHNTELWNNWKFLGDKVEKFFILHNSNVAISQSVLNCYERNYHSSDMPLIYNGIEEIIQKPFPHLVKNKKNILFAGRLEKQKGIDILIKVINILKDNDRYFFHIVGDGSLRQEFVKLIGHNYKVYDKVFGLSSYLSSFDYLFMPSNFEGLALMPIEASLAKLPSIINSCPGLEDTLPQDWPLKVINNNIDDFIKIFKEDIFKLDYNTLQETAYKYAKQKFSLKTMQNKYEELYSNKVK